MARIEAGEGNKGREREWLARAVRGPRDRAWIADGYISDRWLPVSPVTGAVDAFEWKAPVDAIGRGDETLLIEESHEPPEPPPRVEGRGPREGNVPKKPSSVARRRSRRCAAPRAGRRAIGASAPRPSLRRTGPARRASRAAGPSAVEAGASTWRRPSPTIRAWRRPIQTRALPRSSACAQRKSAKFAGAARAPNLP